MITAQKMKFSIKNSFSSKCMFSIKDFFTYNEEILNGKLHFLRSGWHIIMIILPKEYDKQEKVKTNQQRKTNEKNVIIYFLQAAIHLQFQTLFQLFRQVH